VATASLPTRLEQCDDGNTTAGDGCKGATCAFGDHGRNRAQRHLATAKWARSTPYALITAAITPGTDLQDRPHGDRPRIRRRDLRWQGPRLVLRADTVITLYGSDGHEHTTSLCCGLLAHRSDGRSPRAPPRRGHVLRQGRGTSRTTPHFGLHAVEIKAAASWQRKVEGSEEARRWGRGAPRRAIASGLR
jgi:cysteine-rich repeat protein